MTPPNFRISNVAKPVPMSIGSQVSRPFLTPTCCRTWFKGPTPLFASTSPPRPDLAATRVNLRLVPLREDRRKHLKER